MDKQTTGSGPVAPAEVFTPTQLEDLTRRIIDSGSLGRSRVYVQLLEYLLQAAVDGRSPKELEIALDVLGRNASFDVSRDSVVRVYVHQLRKRLDTYYSRHEPEASWRIVIPRGQYTIAAVPHAAAPETRPSSPSGRRWWIPGLMAAVVCLLLGNIYLLSRSSDQGIPATPAAMHPMWQAILDDSTPVLLVMGDYYIFGERDPSGRITRMIRDFNINSRDDLNQQFIEQPGLIDSYLDLNLNYLPEGSATALARIMPVLEQGRKTVRVTMMSRLTTSELRANHVIYVGYISALDKLRRLTFASSGLRVGRTYDELYNPTSGETYSSDAGLPQPNQPFRDYGLLSTFPSPGGTQFIIIASTRDAALMHTAQMAVDAGQLAEIGQSLPMANDAASAFEALYEVIGIERTDFDGRLIYSRRLIPAEIWSAEPGLD